MDSYATVATIFVSSLLSVSATLGGGKGKRHHPHRTEKRMGPAQGHKTSLPLPSCFGEFLHNL